MKIAKIGLQFVGVSLLFWGCASAPPAAPDWVVAPPGVVGNDMIFVGSGQDDSGNPVTAEAAAKGDLTAQVLQYMGVKVTNTTTATAKASLDSFKTSIEDVVKSESKAQVSGFRFGEKYLAKTGKGGVIVYMKGIYGKAEIEAEKARLQKIFQEQADAVDKPAKEAADLVASGKYFAAIQKLIEGASAASTSDMDNAAIKFENYVNKAREILSKISIIPLNPGQTTNVGQPFPASFDFKVVYGSTENDPAIPAANLRISYKVKKNARVSVAGVTVKTDKDGVANFTYPTPDFAAKDNVTAILDVNSYLDTLATVPRVYRDQVTSLEETAAKNKAMVPFTVTSNAKNLPIAILILDVGQDGTNLKKTDTTSGLMESLTKGGFKVSQIAGVDAAFLKTADDSEIVAKLKAAVGPNVKRIAYGFVTISEADNGARATARAGGSIKVVDVAGGDVLFSQNKNKRSTGSSQEAAIASAFRGLGADFASSMIDELP